MKSPKRPIGSFIYRPTGVGKTELANLLHHLYLMKRHFKIGYDGYMEKNAVARLLGAQVMLVMKRRTINRRNQTLFSNSFDEIEKAHEGFQHPFTSLRQED